MKKTMMVLAAMAFAGSVASVQVVPSENHVKGCARLGEVAAGNKFMQMDRETAEKAVREQAKEMNAKIDRDYQEGNTIHWAIVDKATRKIVGTCGYYRGFDNEEGELGCVLLLPYRGQGYMTAALSLLIDFGLNAIGLKGIFAVTSQDNNKAIRLLERLGFIKTDNLKGKKVKYQLPSQ